uniref:Uncharacterized protein n=1 Tax=Tetranychus urticae TaxID=32264 RepID=T1L5J5_TETUR
MNILLENFAQICKKILTRLFRAVHFYCLVVEFHLVSHKEFEPL